MDSDQDGYITQKEFADGLGSIMNDAILADALFKCIDEGHDDRIDFREYVNGMIVLLKGTPKQQVEYGFRLFSPDSNGLVSKENFEGILKAIGRSLGAIHFDQHALLHEIFDKADPEKRNVISLEQYSAVALEKRRFIQSLGVLSNSIGEDSSVSSLSTSSSKVLTTSGKELSALHSTIPITFGNPNWDLSYSMFFGIRLAVAEITSAQEKSAQHKLQSKDFELQVEWELKSINATHEAWLFRDYAPLVFSRLRHIFHVNTQIYMSSLGPEKILGNLLLGSLGALCEMVSTGRSGSFFFKTNDGKYLIKTLAPEEHDVFQKILPSYFSHMNTNPNSLLTHFLGLHCMKKLSEKEIHFTVMRNLFDSSFPLHEQYDLKGSTIGRHVEVTTLDPSVALKDNDFCRRINLGSIAKARLLEQVENDVQFMEQFGICDYSFLIGFHFFTADEERLVAAYLERRENQISNKEASSQGSMFRRDFGGIISKDGKELYFMGIIDNLATWDLKKMGEHFAKSLFHDPNQISAVKPAHYRARFQRFIESIVD